MGSIPIYPQPFLTVLILVYSVARRTPIRKNLLYKGGLKDNSNPKKSKVNSKTYYFTRFSKNAFSKTHLDDRVFKSSEESGTDSAPEGEGIVVRY
jgi:hypothetical protein